jgi:hypothetical protein
MTRIADNPTIPAGFDGQGLVKVFPEHKTAGEQRQETVHEVVRSIATGVLMGADGAGHGYEIATAFGRFASELSHHDATRHIANAIHDALGESGNAPVHLGVDLSTSKDSDAVVWLSDDGAVKIMCGDQSIQQALAETSHVQGAPGDDPAEQWLSQNLEKAKVAYRGEPQGVCELCSGIGTVGRVQNLPDGSKMVDSEGPRDPCPDCTKPEGEVEAWMTDEYAIGYTYAYFAKQTLPGGDFHLNPAGRSIFYKDICLKYPEFSGLQNQRWFELPETLVKILRLIASADQQGGE